MIGLLTITQLYATEKMKIYDSFIINNYIKVHIDTNRVNVEWEEFQNIPAEHKQKYFSRSQDFETFGYLVYVLKKDEKNDKTTRLTRSLRQLNDYKEQIYYTKQACLTIPDLLPGKTYFVMIKYVLNEKVSNKIHITKIGPDLVIRENSLISFTTTNDYIQSGTADECNFQVIPNISLKELFTHRNKFVNSIIAAEGYFRINSEIMFSKVKKTMKEKQNKNVTALQYMNDGAITDGKYILHLPRLGYLLNPPRFDGKAPEKENYLHVIGMLVKQDNFEGTKIEEKKYSFILLSVEKIEYK